MTEKRALITRPAAESASLVARLAACGIQADAAPMLEIRPQPPDGKSLQAALAGVTALLFTSANGVRAFASSSTRRDLTVYAVGEASAQAAIAAGFTDVTAAGGDVHSLADLVADHHPPQQGALLHAAGATLAGDLQGMLRKTGHDVRRLTFYAAEPVRALPHAVAARFAAGGYAAALFFSPRTAATFVSLSMAANIATGAQACTALCLSENVAAALQGMTWRAVKIAARPREEDLIALLECQQ